MKLRILAAVALLPMLLAVILFLPPVFSAVLFAVLAAIAAFELLRGTGYVQHPRMLAYSVVAAFATVIWSWFGMPQLWGLVGVTVFTALLFAELMASGLKLGFDKMALCICGGLLVPHLFASLARILALSDAGKTLVLIPFLLAFVSDSGAYFGGWLFGKHKLAPVISPKKTVEGAIGGVIAAMGAMALFCFLLQQFFGFTPNYIYALIYGLAGSLAGMFGDLCFSVIKRQTGIKDYGNLIPGHGGVLDRFDSMILIGPVTELLLILIPVVV